MSSQRKGIRLSSSDERIKKWWKYVSSRPEKNGTLHIQVALNYHKQTNQYLTIGQIDRTDNSDIPNSNMQFYLTDELSRWLDERAKETGLKQSQVIKAILENSIADADSYNCLSNAEIYNHLINPSAPAAPAEQITTPKTVEATENEKSQEIVHSDNEDKILLPPITFEEKEEKRQEEEDEEELDLISAMLRENGGGLGM